MKILNYVLGKSSIICDLIKAVGSLTKAMRDLVATNEKIIQLEIENKRMINDLYVAVDEILAILTYVSPSDSLDTTKIQTKTSPPESTEISDKKKKAIN